jgi:hypothetical protein
LTTKQIRITTIAEDIVKEYAGQDSISRGIMRMKEILQEKDREISKLKEIADNLQKKGIAGSNSQDYHGEVFWKQMEETVTKSLQLVTGSKPTFQPASKLVVTSASGKMPVTPVTYGKIGDDEKLVEPVGRQGREVK